MKVEDYLFYKRLDAALNNRRGAKCEEHHNVLCEVCGTNIANYNGPYPGVICSTCYEPNDNVSGCTRIKPLAITRGTLRE